MFVIKENNLLLVGHRNCTDGLWDIPLHNPTPLTSLTLLSTPHTFYKKDSMTKEKVTTTKAEKNRKEVNTFRKIFKGSDNLNNLNACNHICNQQMKTDCINSPKHTLAVIIHKDQTKQNLENYLIASCFSPVQSTILNAIKNMFQHSREWIIYLWQSIHQQVKLRYKGTNTKNTKAYNLQKNYRNM